MPAPKHLHDILDAIFDQGDEEFCRGTELNLSLTLRGVVGHTHIKRFPGSAAEAVLFTVAGARENRPKKSMSPKEPKGNA